MKNYAGEWNTAEERKTFSVSSEANSRAMANVRVRPPKHSFNFPNEVGSNV